MQTFFTALILERHCQKLAAEYFLVCVSAKISQLEESSFVVMSIFLQMFIASKDEKLMFCSKLCLKKSD